MSPSMGWGSPNLPKGIARVVGGITGFKPNTNKYNNVQMFEPFQDRNQNFFGKISLSFRKHIGSIVLGPNHSGIFC